MISRGFLVIVALSMANSPITGLLAATLWGTGVCYVADHARDGV